MISHISIKDFAIIEEVDIDLNSGLNIITGETGAGKSIIIEAISLALGARADTTMVRSGANKALIQLVFDDDTVITREVNKSGKSLSKVNGEIVNLTELASKTGKLADIHGQYDHQSLLDPENHIAIIDSYNKSEIAPLLAKVRETFNSYSAISNELKKLVESENSAKRELEFMQFELSEIEKIDPKSGEDMELTDKLNVLQNSEKIHSALAVAYEVLNQNALGTTKQDLENIAEYSDELRDISERINDAYYDLEDVTGEIHNYLDSMEYSEAILNSTMSRLDALEKLKDKHGVSSVDELLEYKDEISKKLGYIENFDEEKEKLIAEEESAKERLFDASKELSFLRRGIAKEIEQKVSEELKDLSFSNTEFKVDFKMIEPTSEGVDKIEFLISPNKGLPLLPLSKIVSGGEMSRIMLAFKSILGDYDQIPTMIFDEIDSGISGATASIVGEKMKEMGSKHQIICITHLPQIAACSNNHYMIRKSADDDMTYTTVTALNENEHINEIARLLGGKNITENTIENAKELIALS